MNARARQLLQGLLFGVVFGFLLHKGGVTRFDVIVGQLLLEDFTVLKIMLTAVAVGSVGIHLLQRLGWAQFSPKRGSWGRNAVGGLIFGAGFALLGYCPGTIAAAVGAGRLDALAGGLPGILIGSGLLAAAYPRLKTGAFAWGDFGDMTWPRLFKVSAWRVIVPLLLLIALAFWLLERAGL